MTLGTKRLVVLIVGWGFVMLGVAGLFLPVLQGIFFLLIGLIVLSSEYAWAHHWLTKLRSRFPAVARQADAAEAKAAVWLRRMFRQRDVD